MPLPLIQIFPIRGRNAPPPPCSRASNLDKINWEKNLSPDLWSGNKNVEITKGEYVLNGNKELNSISLSLAAHIRSLVNLNGHRLTIGAGGILVGSRDLTLINNGELSSSSGAINIYTVAPDIGSAYALGIGASIVDNSSGRVGLNIISKSGDEKSGRVVGVSLNGSASNRFTGDTNISGDGVHLGLDKENGATAIIGNVNVRDGAWLLIYRSSQLSKESKVLLSGTKGKEGSFRFWSVFQSDITESIRELAVEGHGILSYDERGSGIHGQRTLYLQDLIITEGSLLLIKEWKEGRDHLLVRKDSKNLWEALDGIVFENDKAKKAGVREYDEVYWEIGAGFPEPSICGAIFGATGLALVAWKRRCIPRFRKSQKDDVSNEVAHPIGIVTRRSSAR